MKTIKELTREQMAMKVRVTYPDNKGNYDTTLWDVVEKWAKQAKGKKINTWDASIMRLLKYKEEGKYPVEWCDRKIDDILRDRKIWMANRHYMHR